MSQGKLLRSIRRRARIQQMRRWIVWGAVAFALYTYVVGPHGYIHYRKLKGQEKALVDERRRWTAQAADFEVEIDLLKTDTLYIERVARERYGFVRKGERVYRLVTH